MEPCTFLGTHYPSLKVQTSFKYIAPNIEQDNRQQYQLPPASFGRQVVAEGFGTMILVATIVGSGMMGDRGPIQ